MMRVKSETKEKDQKPQPVSPSKSSVKKTSNRQSPSKKEKNCFLAADVSPLEHANSQVVATCSEEVGTSEEQLDSNRSPAQKLFQRTLSPADVLHVHSYAKGDYGEGEAPPKEEKRREADEIDKDNGHLIKDVSVHRSLHTNCSVLKKCVELLIGQLQFVSLHQSGPLVAPIWK